MEALHRKFEKSRIVFWYDEKAELRKEFEAFHREDVEKVEIVNNEFGLKFQMLRSQPQQKFLVYKEGPQPEPLENWLLDVQLSNDVFRTDRFSQILDELELPFEFREIVEKHEGFFKSTKRVADLKNWLKNDDTANRLRLKMLAVCANSDIRIDSVMEHLLTELSQNKSDRYKQIVNSGLEAFLFDELHRAFRYSSDSPSLQDFVLVLFASCYASEAGGDVPLNSEAVVFLRRWMDSFKHRDSFRLMSAKSAKDLNIQHDLQERSIRDLIGIDFFELVDQRIISELCEVIVEQRLSSGECKQIIRSRRNTHWYQQYENLYETLEYGVQFLSSLNQLKIQLPSRIQAVESYVQSFQQVDFAYRKFILYYRRSEQKSLFSKLFTIICNRYSNEFLLPLNNQWQEIVDQSEHWNLEQLPQQHSFFATNVASTYLSKNKKVYVIISDALRFEAGVELCSLINSEDRFDAQVDYMVTGLPSYTQLGMAALLPHQEISINGDKGATVTIDGTSSSGTANRDKILKEKLNGRGLAISAADLLDMTTKQCGELVRDNDVIYVYHNRIDDTGHNQKSEREVFEATETAFSELIRIVKMLTSGNATNLLITADHGFIYQDDVVESDYSSAEPKSKGVTALDRRFAIGSDLPDQDGIKKYSAKDLRLSGDFEVLIPKSINRFRKSGSASRFVHGGCTLQEVVVPVLQVHKGRTSEISFVDVTLIGSSSDIISAGQLAVTFYQSEPVSDKVRPRHLRIGLYAGDKVLVSDQHEITFDYDSENAREREQRVRLVLSKEADQFNEQQVTLLVEELVPGTAQFRDYRNVSYTLRRSFTSDFDF